MSAVIHMISGPRNISTAMMYAFDNRKHCLGVDEPFYSSYLSRFPDIVHPGREEILASQSREELLVWDNLDFLSTRQSELFIKNMAHHVHDLDLSRLKNHKCFLLIRDPKKILTSFSKVVDKVKATDIGIIEEWNIAQYLKAQGTACPVVDTDEFLKNPRGQLEVLCDNLDIRFEESMLSWPSGPKEIDGCWAKYWYQSVHASTGFALYQQSKISLSEKLEDVYQEVLPYYEMLKKEAII